MTRSPEALRLNALQPVLEKRHALLRAIRRFFDARGFLEVHTPVRLPAPAMELHIDAEPSGEWFLRTSPEFHMKRLLAAGLDRLYQVGPCFRRGEAGGWHHPEYTMLEWYRSGTDYMGMLDDTRELLRNVTEAVLGAPRVPWRGCVIDVAAPWNAMTVSEVFLRHAGWDPVAAFDADRFDQDLTEKVEAALPTGVPVVLKDYPAPRAALARCKPEHSGVAERWELYLGGMEIANAYTELTDAVEQRRRFRRWEIERAAMGRVVYPADEVFLAALDAGLPPCGGIALGVDRLLMVLCDRRTIAEVLAFPA